MPEEMKGVIDGLLANAQFDYQVRQEALQSLEEVYRLLDDPLLVNNKEMAAGICGMLIKMLIHEGVMKEGSIAHHLGLRLLDYLGRVHDESTKELC
jgi:hypothetical protein